MRFMVADSKPIISTVLVNAPMSNGPPQIFLTSVENLSAGFFSSAGHGKRLDILGIALCLLCAAPVAHSAEEGNLLTR